MPQRYIKLQKEKEKCATMPTYTGTCYCRAVKYNLDLKTPQDARTSLCHCHNCKKAYGNYAITVKVPLSCFKYTESPTLKKHSMDNGSGKVLNREFCGECGSFICDYGDAAKNDFRYVLLGTIDEPGVHDEIFKPQGEFYISQRMKWFPPIPGG
ncbi:hypothetical protein D9758_009997 [Tetrapyrgos nigripes]|uniref:CENP-V/GFA domain-containing protein n=1 Tax=Tetrapyrgos nigripes TaxID=182062 RepID=A0A8H5CU79_9AGAR|nr:hypothetical protein D9758_009997 [Tetrapyrgos nigripes]